MKRSIKTWLIITASTAFGAALGMLFAPDTKNKSCAKTIKEKNKHISDLKS